MLTRRFSPESVGAALLAKADWQPYPTARERDAWEALPGGLRQKVLARAEKAVGTGWPELTASHFLEFAREGNRSRYEERHFDRRSRVELLAIAACIDGTERFVDALVDGVWAICEESFWGVPAHVGMQRTGRGLPDPDEEIVDLFAAETAALLAWVDYLLGDRLDAVSPHVRTRIERETQRRVLAPCRERDDFGWMGFDGRRVNNWNPWICSNWLATTLLLERDKVRRRSDVAKIWRTLENFVAPYPVDGGCDEGPSYWGRAGASLFDCLDLVHSATAGAIDVFDEPRIGQIGRFVYRVQIAGDYFLNFADAPARVEPDAAVVFAYGKRIGDGAMQRLGAWLAQRQDVGGGHGIGERLRSLTRQLRTLFLLGQIPPAPSHPPLPRDVWLPAIEVFAARDQEGSDTGWYVAAKGGHNDESHNHNDVGSFVVYRDGRPLLVDAGVESYTAKTFSDQRYEIWTMQSAYHNLLPVIDGVMQAAGEAFRAAGADCQIRDSQALFCLDLAGAYPASAKLAQWQRTIALERGAGVRIDDEFAFDGLVAQVQLSLLTPCDVAPGPAGRIRLRERALDDSRRSGTGELLYDADVFEVVTESLILEDSRMAQHWGGRLERIALVARRPPRSGRWTWRLTR